MATTLAQLREKVLAQENRSTGNKQQSGGDNAIYPHWDIPEGSTSRVRFLPDGNDKNSFFWVERAMIKLPFAGVKGQSDSKQVVVQVPCMEMYGESCPILAEVRPWFKDPSLEEMGRAYWKKKSYIFQGFVRDNPLADDKHPENPIRRFTISPQIFNIIKAAIMDPEMEELPTDLQRGLDFQIVKTTKGNYADYTTSKWSRKESSLTSEENEAIEKHGLFNLSDFLPKKPSDTDLKVIKEMFEASVNGEPYDAERWGAYYKPYGLDVGNASKAPASAPSSPVVDTVPVAKTATAPVEDDEAFEVADSVVAPAKQSSQRAEDILAMIRNRKSTT